MVCVYHASGLGWFSHSLPAFHRLSFILSSALISFFFSKLLEGLLEASTVLIYHHPKLIFLAHQQTSGSCLISTDASGIFLSMDMSQSQTRGSRSPITRYWGSPRWDSAVQRINSETRQRTFFVYTVRCSMIDQLYLQLRFTSTICKLLYLCYR